MISKNRLFAAVVGLGLMLAPGVSAAQQVKIAVVNSAEVVQKSPQYQAAEAQMKNEFGKRKAQLDAEGRKLAEDVDAFKKNKDVMTPDDRVKKENALLSRQNDLKYAQSKFRSDFQKREQQMGRQMMDEIKSVIDQIAKQKGYSLVLQDPVYAVPGMDITDEVLKRLKSLPASKRR